MGHMRRQSTEKAHVRINEDNTEKLKVISESSPLKPNLSTLVDHAINFAFRHNAFDMWKEALELRREP